MLLFDYNITVDNNNNTKRKNKRKKKKGGNKKKEREWGRVDERPISSGGYNVRKALIEFGLRMKWTGDRNSLYLPHQLRSLSLSLFLLPSRLRCRPYTGAQQAKIKMIAKCSIEIA